MVVKLSDKIGCELHRIKILVFVVVDIDTAASITWKLNNRWH